MKLILSGVVLVFATVFAVSGHGGTPVSEPFRVPTSLLTDAALDELEQSIEALPTFPSFPGAERVAVTADISPTALRW